MENEDLEIKRVEIISLLTNEFGEDIKFLRKINKITFGLISGNYEEMQ